jgi:hypothetical protein
MAKEEEWEEFTRNLGGGLKAIRSAKAMGREVLANGEAGVARGGGRRGRDVTV